MAILTYPLNGVTYDAEDVETYLCTRTSGVFASDGHYPASATGNRTVTIGPGLAWMKNEEFHGKAVYNPDDVELPIAEADAYQDRIDRIVLQFDKLLNQTTLMVKQGTPSSNPVPPDIERTELIYELGLYTVSVPASSIAVTDSQIASTILDESVCGIMEDAVTSIPTQELYDQWYSWFSEIQTNTEEFERQFNTWFEEIREEAEADMASYNEQFEVWMNGSKVSFEEWFDTVQDTLDSDTAGKLTNLVNDAQDTADEALEQLITGQVRGFITDEYEGGEYALLADDADENYGITVSRPICKCDDDEGITVAEELISDEFNEEFTYSAGDYCIYDNTLYRFTEDKSAGTWDYNVVQATNVGTELGTQAKASDNNASAIAQNTRVIDEINSALAELDNTVSAKQNALSVQTISVDNITVAASDYNVVTADVSRSGYTALGIVGFMVSNASSSGTASSRCFPYECRLQSSTTARMYLRNTYTSDAKVAVYFYVLYAAN